MQQTQGMPQQQQGQGISMQHQQGVVPQVSGPPMMVPGAGVQPQQQQQPGGSQEGIVVSQQQAVGQPQPGGQQRGREVRNKYNGLRFRGEKKEIFP